MSRVANNPIKLPDGVDISADQNTFTVTGEKETLSMSRLPGVAVDVDDGVARVTLAEGGEVKFAGTARALLAQMVTGVSEGFERKLELVGVGFRAQVAGSELSLVLGFSHPVKYTIPDGVTVETPSATEVLVKGANKQAVGQVAADIRALRPPEPYKGKGVRYAGERIHMKEAKKA